MILRTPGDEFQYNEILYKIGEPMKINVMDVDCVQMHVTKMRSG